MQTYKSRWGHHPTDYPTYEKLKSLKKRYWQTVYAVARWSRWSRKTVHQHGPEPRYCPVFVEEKGHWESFKNREGHTGYRFRAKTLVDRGVLEAFQSARTPVESSENVKGLNLSVEEIDRLHAEVEAWFREEALGLERSSHKS